MTLALHAHPFSSYSQKVLIALYENATPFEFRMLGDAESFAGLTALWPLGKFPVLVDGGTVVAEASIIIEHLGLHHPGPVALLPSDPAEALAVRALDRFFDQYVMTPMQAIVDDVRGAAGVPDPERTPRARAALDTAYAWLDATLQGREWAAGGGFSLADCAAAPSLFYADWVHPVDRFPAVADYRARLLARPSFARAVEEARPYRPLFPPGAPDRD